MYFQDLKPKEINTNSTERDHASHGGHTAENGDYINHTKQLVVHGQLGPWSNKNKLRKATTS